MRSSLLVPLLLLSAGALRADEVRLLNGRTLEGVVSAESEDAVELQVPGGTISIPRAKVREIVRSDSAWTEYQSRAAELRKSGGEARDWVQLAHWASGERMDTAARDAALEAARIDPRLAELAPVMRGFGYELDEPTSRWLPFEEAMRSRGLVPVDGNWLTPQEAAELRRRSEEEARARELERLDRAAAEARLAAAELEASRASAYDYGNGPWNNYGGWISPYYVPYVSPVYVPYLPIPGVRPDRPRPTPHVDGGSPPPPPAQQPAKGGNTHGGVKRPPTGGAESPGARSGSSPRP